MVRTVRTQLSPTLHGTERSRNRRDYAANFRPWIPSSSCRNSGCGARHMVRYASPAIPPKLGAECSNPGSCSSRLHSKPSQSFPGPLKSPTAASIRRSGLGVRFRNVPPIRSPNADLSPELESRPFYSTSFFASGFSGLASFATRKVGIPFACRLPRSQQQTGSMTPKPQCLIRLSLQTQRLTRHGQPLWATIFPRKCLALLSMASDSHADVSDPPDFLFGSGASS